MGSAARCITRYTLSAGSLSVSRGGSHGDCSLHKVRLTCFCFNPSLISRSLSREKEGGQWNLVKGMEEGEKEEPKNMAEKVVRVLVVDDSLLDRKIVERLIQGSGDIFEVVTVDSGKKALEVLGLIEGKDLPVAKDQKIDIVLTDYWMLEMTGYDLLKALKEHSCSRSIPVVMMSSENDAQRIASCLTSGAEDFILKPLQIKHVQNLRLFARPKTALPQATKLTLDLISESGGSDRRSCLAGVAVA